MEKINLECLEYLEENNIAKESLPKSIKGKMNSLSGLVKRYENKPTQKTKEAIKRIDIAVADLIADWVEQEFPEKFEETPNSIEEQIEIAAKEIEETPPPAPPTPPTPAPEPKAVETPPTPTPAPEPKKEEQTPPPPPPSADKKLEEMVAEIKKNLNTDNRIKVSVLTSIIGKSPSYPTQVVGDLKLTKVFLNDYYRVIN